MDALIHNSHVNIKTSFFGSKALAHRYLIGAFLTGQAVSISNLPISDDINITKECLIKLGAKITSYDNGHSLIIQRNKIPYANTITFNVKKSVSTLRLLLPVSLQFASKIVFQCDSSIYDKSLDIYDDLISKCNLCIKKEDGCIICSGSINLDYYEITQNVSPQFVTGLIINAIYQKKAATIKVYDNFLSKKYCDLSINVLNKLGFDIEYTNNYYLVHNKQIQIWDMYNIEGDYSNASYMIALGAFNGKTVAKSLNENSIQPDYEMVNILKQMGAYIKYINEDGKYLYAANNSLFEKGILRQLKCGTFNVNECNNQLYLLIILTSFLKGKSTIINFKTDDILSNFITELKKLNIDVKINNDQIIINGKKEYNNSNVILNSFDNPRIIMAFTVFGLLNKGSIIINNIDSINKTFPEFFEILINSTKNGAIQIKDTN